MNTTEFGSEKRIDCPADFQHIKWRRRGKERRIDMTSSSRKPETYAEKRSSGDRRFTVLEFISKIIFPRGKNEFRF